MKHRKMCLINPNIAKINVSLFSSWQAVAKGPKDVVGKKDLARAEEKVPRGHYKGNH